MHSDVEGAHWLEGALKETGVFVAQFAQSKETGLMIEKNSEDT